MGDDMDIPAQDNGITIYFNRQFKAHFNDSVLFSLHATFAELLPLLIIDFLASAHKFWRALPNIDNIIVIRDKSCHIMAHKSASLWEKISVNF